jgi:DNA-binding transcriptional ArsR family regulator
MLKHIDANNIKDTSCCSDECVEILTALTDVTRQKIIALFYENKELCVTRIVEQFELSRSTISHHLNLMKRAKLLNARKEGKEIYYSFNREHVIQLMESILVSLKKCKC